ncbi:hypothetical protein [Paraburkholderia youngii]|uniref:hypothetical protein n=1 Tax=Paraburkholderia youngii TaxID=2782701 RepID=UPI003D22C8B8
MNKSTTEAAGAEPKIPEAPAIAEADIPRAIRNFEIARWLISGVPGAMFIVGFGAALAINTGQRVMFGLLPAIVGLAAFGCIGIPMIFFRNPYHFLSPGMCAEVNALCKAVPGVARYRDAVRAQNRPFLVQDWLNVRKYRDAREAWEQFQEDQAQCRELHGVSDPA